MKIFVSWSGDKSRLAAEFMTKWIKQVIQATEPWISTEIEKGSSWSSEIADKLDETDFGIICLTKSNLDSNWVHFEAGAIIKGTKGKATMLLIDLEPSELGSPLKLFQATTLDKSDVYKLVKTINRSIDRPLDVDTLESVFATNWDSFETEMKSIIALEEEDTYKERTVDEMIEEIVLNTRHIDKNIVEAVNWIIDNMDDSDYFPVDKPPGMKWNPYNQRYSKPIFKTKE